MKRQNLISVEDFCKYYHTEPAFINSLEEYELIEITLIEDDEFISPEQLQQLEKIARLYHDLNVNLEGIDAINHLLNGSK